VSKLQNKGGRLIGTVQDEIIFEAPATVADELAAILRNINDWGGCGFLEQSPVDAEVKVSDSWAEK
jgi:DNA polymerase I-like protein with 3'-5' exonuclease and polymerase domains